MRTLIVLNVLSSLASLAMAAYGLLILMLASGLDPLRTDDTGVALGSGLLAAFLVIPAFCVVASVRLARRDRRLSILLALLPFALVALGVFVVRAVPWPSGPASS
jgi:uncharacterized protein involved in response to NO